MGETFVPIDHGDPAAFPVGSRVSIQTPMEDHHFFRVGTTGTVVRHTGRAYLGVIVLLDRPFTCDNGHYRHEVREFNFNASGLELCRG